MPWYFRIPLVIAVLYSISALIIYLAQDRLMFFPRAYPIGIEHGAKTISYDSSSGSQIAYLLGKTASPEKVWILFGGNGSLALNFGELGKAVSDRDPNACIILLDYPGYGANSGKPGRMAIRDAADQLWKALPSALELSEDDLTERTSLLGHSLGAAVALESAAIWRTPRVIAISPFTTMREMAERKVTRQLSWPLKHRWDNRRAIDEVTSLEGAYVLIFHGNNDGLIPISMARELRDRHPLSAGLIEVANAGHNDIVGRIFPKLVKRMGGG